MLNATTAPAAQAPVNAVNEDQLVDMLCSQGYYHDRVYSALYRLRTRTTTLIEQGHSTIRCERLGDNLYVAELVPAAPRFRAR